MLVSTEAQNWRLIVRNNLRLIIDHVSRIAKQAAVAASIFDAWLSLVERCVRDAEVASSNLVASMWLTPVSTSFEAWLSLVERCVRDAEVASSNLVASTS